MFSPDLILSKIQRAQSVDALLDLRSSLQKALPDFADDKRMQKEIRGLLERIDKRLKEL